MTDTKVESDSEKTQIVDTSVDLGVIDAFYGDVPVDKTFVNWSSPSMVDRAIRNTDALIEKHKADKVEHQKGRKKILNEPLHGIDSREKKMREDWGIIKAELAIDALTARKARLMLEKKETP